MATKARVSGRLSETEFARSNVRCKEAVAQTRWTFGAIVAMASIVFTMVKLVFTDSQSLLGLASKGDRPSE
jgi:hypothetical protein